MTSIDVVLKGARKVDRRTRDGRRLKEIATQLDRSLGTEHRCRTYSRELRLCLYGDAPDALAVSVLDCCCDHHASMVRRLVEGELQGCRKAS